MKKAGHANTSKPTPTRSIPPKIIVSAAARRRLDTKTIRIALQHHRDLDSLPYGFRTPNGAKLMIATNTDLTRTFFFAPKEWELHCASHALRMLDASLIR